MIGLKAETLATHVTKKERKRFEGRCRGTIVEVGFGTGKMQRQMQKEREVEKARMHREWDNKYEKKERH